MAIGRHPRSGQAMRYQLHIELAVIRPTIWRDVSVESQMSLRQLHHIVQAAMGWTSSHLHEFKIASLRYGQPDLDDPDDRLIDDRGVRLGAVLTPGLEFAYIYDWGDNWTHVIHVTAAEPMDEPFGAAAIEAGARACPPEDCGGPYQYQEFLERLAAQPRHREVKAFLKWAGEDFDPDRFDRRDAGAALLRMAWNHWGEELPQSHRTTRR